MLSEKKQLARKYWRGRERKLEVKFFCILASCIFFTSTFVFLFQRHLLKYLISKLLSPPSGLSLDFFFSASLIAHIKYIQTPLVGNCTIRFSEKINYWLISRLIRVVVSGRLEDIFNMQYFCKWYLMIDNLTSSFLLCCVYATEKQEEFLSFQVLI